MKALDDAENNKDHSELNVELNGQVKNGQFIKKETAKAEKAYSDGLKELVGSE